MIFSSLSQTAQYVDLHPLFREAFDFLTGNNLHTLEAGRHPIIGSDVFAIVEEGPGRTHGEAKLECHRKYIDIQYVVEGWDEMGWKSLSECLYPLTDYDAEKDIEFFSDMPSTWIITPPEHFCIFFPEDAHAPMVSNGKLRKVIVKVAVDAT